MKRSIARKWAAALESGDYKQGVGALRNKAGEFCCLGVLCNLHAQDHPEIAQKQKSKTVYMGNSAMPPHEVADWAGMNSVNPITPVEHYTMSGLNDVKKYNFKHIAKIIRKHWKEL